MKISYHKRWDENGTVYNQAIRINKREALILSNAIDSELALKMPRKKEYVFTSGYEIFLKPIHPLNKIVFLNHTQTRFLNLFLKLPLKDRNTCLLIF